MSRLSRWVSLPPSLVELRRTRSLNPSCKLRRAQSSGLASSRGLQRRLALSDLPHHRVHIGVIPDLGELAVFDAIKSKLRSSHPMTGRLNSLEGPPVGTGDREVHRDMAAVDDE